MLKNYIVTTIRNFRRNKGNTFINVAGLALAIACCSFIYAFVKHEYTFDNFHTNADRIYRVVGQYKGTDETTHQGYVSFPLAKALRNDFTDLENVTQVFNRQYAIVKIERASGAYDLFDEDEMAYADEHYLQVFDYPLLAGYGTNLLASPDQVILTRELADKYFGNHYKGNYSELIGKTLVINKNPYQISAILEDIPRNTNITFKMLLPFKAFEKENPEWAANWYNTTSDSYAFVTLSNHHAQANIETQFQSFAKKYFNEETASKRSYALQPLSEVYSISICL